LFSSKYNYIYYFVARILSLIIDYYFLYGQGKRNGKFLKIRFFCYLYSLHEWLVARVFGMWNEEILKMSLLFLKHVPSN